VRLEGLGKLKKKLTLSGTRTGDLPACSTVPQPTTLPRAFGSRCFEKYATFDEVIYFHRMQFIFVQQ
jgi:hypothetical protein